MSRLSALRKKVNYKLSERCINCESFQDGVWFLRNSVPVKGQHLCRRHGFTVGQNHACDMWFPSGKDKTTATKLLHVKVHYNR